MAGRGRSSPGADRRGERSLTCRRSRAASPFWLCSTSSIPSGACNDICRQTGISKTTAYRMLRTLEWKGFVVFDPETERYHLGPAIIPGAYLSLSYVGFVRSTHPFLEDLAKATGETVELTVESAQGAVVVDQVATSHPFKPNLPTGRMLRNLANSAMRMWVALRLGRGARAAAPRAAAQVHPAHHHRPRRTCAAELERAAAGRGRLRPGGAGPRGVRRVGARLRPGG